MIELASIQAFADLAIERLVAADGGRLVVGIAGPPGAGKSTAAAALVAAITDRGIPAAALPMDGYHLPQAQLVRLGRRDRMGAADTFDVDGYVAALRAVRADRGDVVAAGFDRTIEEPVAGAVRIPSAARIVVTEGNWLLLDAGGWQPVAAELDLSAFIAVDDAVRIHGLIERHVRFGKSAQDAAAWVARSDEANAVRIAPTAARADVILRRR